MRLWNRNTSNGVANNGQPQPPGQSSTASTASTAATSKRRLRESNSIEDSSKDVIKSPKPSAKTKKIDETNKNKNNNSQQLVQTQHEVTTRGHQDKRGKITFSSYIHYGSSMMLKVS